MKCKRCGSKDIVLYKKIHRCSLCDSTNIEGVKIPERPVNNNRDNNYTLFSNTFFRFAAILVGLAFIVFGIVRLSQGDLGWSEYYDGDSHTSIPMSIVGPILGACFIYCGFRGRSL